jgi:hypothetical protein
MTLKSACFWLAGNSSASKNQASSWRLYNYPHVIDFMGYEVFCRSGFISEKSQISKSFANKD